VAAEAVLSDYEALKALKAKLEADAVAAMDSLDVVKAKEKEQLESIASLKEKMTLTRTITLTRWWAAAHNGNG